MSMWNDVTIFYHEQLKAISRLTLLYSLHNGFCILNEQIYTLLKSVLTVFGYRGKDHTDVKQSITYGLLLSFFTFNPSHVLLMRIYELN